MTSRQQFMARVRAGLGRDTARTGGVVVAPTVDEDVFRLTHGGETLADVFAARAAHTGMTVERCTLSTLAEVARALFRGLETGSVVLDGLDARLASTIGQVLAERGTALIEPRVGRGLDEQFDAAVGVTGVVAAIAESGTLVLTSGAERSRGGFLIPPVHVALVLESQLVPDMLDLWPLVGNRLPTALTLVSGPSKTADIEGILITGVHGPRAVHVVLIAEESHPGVQPSRRPWRTKEDEQ